LGKIACLGAVWVGEHDGVHGFASGVTGGELSPARVLLCSGVCVTSGAGLSARPGEKWPWAKWFTWADPIGGYVFHF
jgi:hypothetical protein